MALSSAKHRPQDRMRAPKQVMRLARMGAFHQTRLSFARVLLRRLKTEGWSVDRPRFDINAQGVGVATYAVSNGERTYTLVAFAHDLPDEMRSDRVIAEAWDSTFCLFDGVPEDSDIERLSNNVPLQEAGRVGESEFILSRANRSVRLFAHTIDRLSQGMQPDAEQIEDVGYLMRTTAVYGSGKFGAADRDVWRDRPEFAGSFQPEMLTVWLIRAFTVDLVEHLARQKGGEQAVSLNADLKRKLGVGNSTGLGMAPFLINHPALIHAWIAGREEALARVRDIAAGIPEHWALLDRLVASARKMAALWQSSHPVQATKIAELGADLDRFSAWFETFDRQTPYPFDAIVCWAEDNLGLEAQEMITSLLMEPHGDLIDDLAPSMSADESARFRIDAKRSVGDVRSQIESRYGWASDLDFDDPKQCARIWYVSQEKLEPRLGERAKENLTAYEQPLAPARDALLMLTDLRAYDPGVSLAHFLMAYPQHRHVARRLQVVEHCPYGEIQDNTVSADMLPIDLLRCKLSLFGATRFDPRSDRWVRIALFANAPYPDELADLDPDLCAWGLSDSGLEMLQPVL